MGVGRLIMRERNIGLVCFFSEVCVFMFRCLCCIVRSSHN